MSEKYPIPRAVFWKGSDCPNQYDGSLGAVKELAKLYADKLSAWAQGQARPEAAALYAYTHSAMAEACCIAKMSREKIYPSTALFVHAQTRLSEYLDRAEILRKESAVLDRWPKSPWAAISTKSGNSAVQVGLSFAQGILSATRIAPTIKPGCFISNFPPDLRVADPDPDPKITAWRDETMKELREHTFPPLPAWKIRVEEQQMGSWLDDEYKGYLLAMDKAGGKMLTAEEAARKRGVNITTVTRRARRGKIPNAELIDGEWKISESSLSAIPKGKVKRKPDKPAKVVKPAVKLPAAVVWECANCQNEVTSDTKPITCKCGRPVFTRKTRPPILDHQ
jgi:hypothetical protein